MQLRPSSAAFRSRPNAKTFGQMSKSPRASEVDECQLQDFRLRLPADFPAFLHGVEPSLRCPNPVAPHESDALEKTGGPRQHRRRANAAYAVLTTNQLLNGCPHMPVLSGWAAVDPSKITFSTTVSV